ncbi:MAG: hypothetical protein AAB581_02520 [Patescibacteria group bacterium]
MQNKNPTTNVNGAISIPTASYMEERTTVTPQRTAANRIHHGNPVMKFTISIFFSFQRAAFRPPNAMERVMEKNGRRVKRFAPRSKTFSPPLLCP